MPVLPHTFSADDGDTYRVELIAGPEQLPQLPQDEEQQHAFKIVRLRDNDWRKVRMSIGGEWKASAECAAQVTRLPQPVDDDFDLLYLAEIERSIGEIWGCEPGATYHQFFLDDVAAQDGLLAIVSARAA